MDYCPSLWECFFFLVAGDRLVWVNACSCLVLSGLQWNAMIFYRCILCLYNSNGLQAHDHFPAVNPKLRAVDAWITNGTYRLGLSQLVPTSTWLLTTVTLGVIMWLPCPDNIECQVGRLLSQQITNCARGYYRRPYRQPHSWMRF